jgi:hypothetical protein
MMESHEALDIPLAEQIEIEALAQVRRTDFARQLGATVRDHATAPVALGDRVRRIGALLDQEDREARRREAMDRLAVPSDLIARAKRDWPAQVRAVQTLADRLGVSVGEAWEIVIGAGIKATRKHRIR